VLYVDNMICTSSRKLIVWCKEKLANNFDMKDTGLLNDLADNTLYKKSIESLMYLANTKLPISYVVNT
jgi:hypothetical protein